MTDFNRLNILFDRLLTSVDAIGRTRPIDEILRDVEGVARALAREKTLTLSLARDADANQRSSRRPNEWQQVGAVVERVVSRFKS